MIAPLLNLPATLPQSLAAQSSESHWNTAQSLLLDPFGLDQTKLEGVLARMQGPGVDAADLYFQYTRHEAWGLEEGIVKNGSFSIDQGVGVRACSGDKTAFAYADAISLESLENAADVVKSIGGDMQDRRLQVDAKEAKSSAHKSHAHSPLYLANDPIATLDSAAKVRVLQLVDKLARAADPRIVQVMASLSAAYDVVLVARENGLRAADVRPLVRLSVSVIAQQGQRKESGSSGGGGRFDLGYFDEVVLQTYVRQAVHSALTNLEARPAPAGEMPVVLGSGWPGVMLHEAVGHGLEGDFNRKGSSAFSGKIGQRVAAKGVTVLDDGTLPGRRGSLSMDDEGHPSQSNTLIEDGILRSYMQDSLNARLMGMPQSGNGRRESYAHLPMPRMTNTYMLGGDTPAEEIISSLDKGLYAVNFGGGQVDITSGQFVFSASEAYWVENGKIQYPVKGATLIGNGPQALQKVKLIGDDLALDGGIGVCGKDGQSVPVGVGQPTLRIDGLVVGGTA